LVDINFQIVNCRATLVVRDDTQFEEKGEHTCLRSSKVISRKEDVVEWMTEMVDDLALKDYSLPVKNIYDHVLQKVFEKYGDVAIAGLSKDQIRHRVSYIRSKSTGNADVFRALELPNLSQVSADDHRLILKFNNIREIEGELIRVTGFAHPDLLYYLLYPGINLYIDGTFRCVPKPYYQCLIIMVYDHASNLYLPVFYVLTTKKNQWSYWYVLNEIIISCQTKLSPAIIHCDFEKSLINSIKEQFPDVVVAGCLFHFKQALLKKMMKLSLPVDDCRIALSAIDVLTLCPHDEIEIIGISYVKFKVNSESEKWSSFWSYFNRTWLLNFSPATWNIHGLSGVQNRTNNALERFNRTFNSHFTTAHPSLIHFLEIVKKQSQETLQTIELVKKGKEKAPNHQVGINYEIPADYSAFKENFLKKHMTSPVTTTSIITTTSDATTATIVTTTTTITLTGKGRGRGRGRPKKL
jgi:hypothetical protein